MAYNWNRQYDPTTGSYTQPDPLGLTAGSSRFAYAGDDPLQRIDPDGEFFFLAVPIAEGIAGEAVASGAAGAIIGGIGGFLVWSHVIPGPTPGDVATATADGAADHKPGDEPACEKAKRDAGAAYFDLVTKIIPQYLNPESGGESNHYDTLQQKQSALKKAIRRLRLYCKPLPPEIGLWESEAGRALPPPTWEE